MAAYSDGVRAAEARVADLARALVPWRVRARARDLCQCDAGIHRRHVQGRVEVDALRGHAPERDLAIDERRAELDDTPAERVERDDWLTSRIRSKRRRVGRPGAQLAALLGGQPLAVRRRALRVLKALCDE